MQKPRLHYIQQVPFEGLGSIAAWASDRAIEVSGTQLYAGMPLPEPGAYDGLVVLGGPMGVHDTVAYPWLNTELRHIESALGAGTPIIGICLGAQMLAQVLGANVYANPCKEIGWFPVKRIGNGDETGIRAVFAEEVTAFHWHGETFDIPRGAIHLASSEACDNQAFAYGDRVLALQYHLETTPSAARELINHCEDELAPGAFVQAPDAIMASPERFATANTHMTRLLEWIEKRLILS